MSRYGKVPFAIQKPKSESLSLFWNLPSYPRLSAVFFSTQLSQMNSFSLRPISKAAKIMQTGKMLSPVDASDLMFWALKPGMSNVKTPSSKQLNMKFPHRKVGNGACWIISQIAWKLAARPEARRDLVFWPPESPWPQTTFALVRHCLLWFLYLVPFLCWMNKERRRMKRTREFPGFSSQNTFLRDENIRTSISNIPFLMDNLRAILAIRMI